MYNIAGLTAHGQDDRREWKKVGSEPPLTNVEPQSDRAAAQVRSYLDMHPPPVLGHGVWKEPPSKLLITSLRNHCWRNWKEQLERTKGVSHHISVGHPSKDSKDYENVYMNTELIYAALFFSLWWCQRKHCRLLDHECPPVDALSKYVADFCLVKRSDSKQHLVVSKSKPNVLNTTMLPGWDHAAIC